jgi:hypothetical protein
LWSELVLVLAECVESVWVRDASLGPDKFDHLSTFGDIDGLCLVLSIVLGKWVSDDFFQNTWR